MLELFQHRPHLALINQNYVDEETDTRLNSGNAYYCSVQNSLSSHLLAKNTKIIIGLLSIAAYTCCSHLEHRASVKSFVSLQLLNLRQSVGLLGRGISPTQGHYLRKQNKRQISMPSVEFEPTVPVFEQAKTFHALDDGVTVIDLIGLHKTTTFPV
jgi:hypothetical protein